jgi:hypothetical protein
VLLYFVLLLFVVIVADAVVPVPVGTVMISAQHRMCVRLLVRPFLYLTA